MGGQASVRVGVVVGRIECENVGRVQGLMEEWWSWRGELGSRSMTSFTLIISYFIKIVLYFVHFILYSNTVITIMYIMTICSKDGHLAKT